ncbi:hypothetical protein TRFO_20191 [Tritrichomonas foetus]|uniref:Uncharacterized protein n=1 Tax=Tritrichomonas foetus TaxID=1144522 RepID=A0A1J4KH58_9EUKA|nr:hypothetical protein TRFO_20191 [Tritrichomonas foetus]|eukprot:OHT10515.1 hypothetical protein TRFO_20191 [Tritrichomonas foetus]
MSESLSSIESMMKEINALKFYPLNDSPKNERTKIDSDDFNSSASGNDYHNYSQLSSNSRQSRHSTISNHSKNDKMKKIEFCIQISELLGKTMNSLDDILEEIKNIMKKTNSKSKIQKKKSLQLLIDNSSFIHKFNTKYQTAISELDDIFPVIDDLKIKARNSNSLSFQGNSQLEKANTQISSLKEQNAALLQSKASFEKAFISASELIETQSEEIKSLSQQRNLLVMHLQTMDSVCSEIDSINHTLKISQIQIQNQQPKENDIIIPPVEKTVNDDSYQLLAASYRAIDTTLHPSFKDELEAIRDNSNKTANDRLVSLIKCVSIHYYDDIQKYQNLVEENEKHKVLLENSQKQCHDVLHHFEEELRFLQKLSHSKDLQSVLFYRPTTGTQLGFDTKEKEELIRKCAEIGKFIDENVGQILLENIEPTVSNFDNLNLNSIFSLMQPGNVEKKISSIITEASESSLLENRKLIDLLVAQVLMNDILTSHTYDLHTKVSLLNRQISKLDVSGKESNDLQQELASYQKEIRSLRRHENKIRHRLSKIIDFNDTDNTVLVVQQLIEAFKKASKKCKHMVKQYQNSKDTNLENAVQHINNENNENEMNNNKKDSSVVEQNEEVKPLQDKITELNNLITENTQKYENELSKLKEENLSKQHEIEIHKEEFIRFEKENQEKINTYIATVDKYKNDILGLKQKLDESVATLKKITKQSKKFESSNSTLSTENQQLKKRVKQLEELNLKSVETIKSKSHALRTQFVATVSDLQKMREDNSSVQQENIRLQSDIEKLKTENDELKIQIKALNLKIKATEDKFELDKKTFQSQIAANATSAQADLDHMTKEKEEKIASFKRDILDITSKYNECNDPIEAVHKLSTQISDFRKVQTIYASLIEDFQSLQRLLNVEPGLKITPHVEKLLNQVSDLESRLLDQKKDIDSENADKQRIARDLMKNQTQIASNIQWENWAKRVLRVVTDSDCSQSTSNRLRQTLEEIIFNSISNKETINKLEILRQEKQLMTKYDPKLLNVKSNSRLSLSNITAVVLAARRLLNISGYSPIVVDPAPTSPKIKSKYRSHDV